MSIIKSTSQAVVINSDEMHSGARASNYEPVRFSALKHAILSRLAILAHRAISPSSKKPRRPHSTVAIPSRRRPVSKPRPSSSPSPRAPSATPMAWPTTCHGMSENWHSDDEGRGDTGCIQERLLPPNEILI